MKNVKYTDMPEEFKESFERSVPVHDFVPTPKDVEKMITAKSKKTVSIFLTTSTVEKFKKAADKTGSRYQTMIKPFFVFANRKTRLTLLGGFGRIFVR